MAQVIDEVRCPKCGCMTLVTDVNECEDGGRFRYCSFVKCDWGLTPNEDVVYNEADPTNISVLVTRGATP